MRKKTIIAASAIALVAAVAAGVFLSSLCSNRTDATPAWMDLSNDGGCEGCNVLLITIETLRADRLKCQGYTADPAPNLCAFGEEALLFENAYTPAPLTMPALQAIMSGTLPSNEDLLEIIAQTATTSSIAAELDGRGYSTAVITDHEVIGDKRHPHPRSLMITRGFGKIENHGNGRWGKTTAETVAAAERWLAEHRSERFFFWTHLFDTHFNWVPSLAAAAKFGFAEKSCVRIHNGMDIFDIRDIQETLTGPERRCIEALYLGELFETDRLVGDLLRRVEELGLDETTLVIIAGDHGEEIAERGFVGHGHSVFDELTHVPLMVRNPRSRAVGRRSVPISTMAIHDYVLAATSGKTPGRLPLPVSRTYRFTNVGLDAQVTSVGTPNDFSLVRGRLKYVVTPQTGARALYDLGTDPRELRNLWGANPSGDSMAAELDRWIRDNRSTADPASNEAVREYFEGVERLKALGYTR